MHERSFVPRFSVRDAGERDASWKAKVFDMSWSSCVDEDEADRPSQNRDEYRETFKKDIHIQQQQQHKRERHSLLVRRILVQDLRGSDLRFGRVGLDVPRGGRRGPDDEKVIEKGMRRGKSHCALLVSPPTHKHLSFLFFLSTSSSSLALVVWLSLYLDLLLLVFSFQTKERLRLTNPGRVRFISFHL